MLKHCKIVKDEVGMPIKGKADMNLWLVTLRLQKLRQVALSLVSFFENKIIKIIFKGCFIDSMQCIFFGST